VPRPSNGGPLAGGEQAVSCLGALPWGYARAFPRGDCLSLGIARVRPGRSDLRAALERAMDGLGIRLHGVELRGHAMPCYQAPPWPFWHGRP
jgi:hypothetical protein